MSRLLVLGGEPAGKLADYLAGRLAGVAEVELACGPPPGGDFVFAVLLLDRPLQQPFAGPAPDVVLVELGGALDEADELGLEAWLKSATGAEKVLVYREERERERAFSKVFDMALSRAGGDRMPEDIPEEVIEAVKAAATGGRITCERAREIAGELDVPIPLVGRALDLLQIKITSCELGCF